MTLITLKQPRDKPIFTTRINQFFAAFFLIYWILIVIDQYQNISTIDLYWICNVLLLVTVAGLLSENEHAITAVLCGSFYLALLFIVDTMSQLLTGMNILGIAGFINDLSPFQIFLTSHHYWLWIFCLYWLYDRKKISRYGWLLAGGISLVLCLITAVTPNHANVNCVDEPCLPAAYVFRYWTPPLGRVGYFAVQGAVILLIYYLTNKIIANILHHKSFKKKLLERRYKKN
jgi:hypothetical protein